jgi:2-polyprenyl-3-methyl-5-hydroxy-6-metoxy-1,4-benzoquinol methylase
MAKDAIAPELVATHARTNKVYEEHAEAYDAHRAKLLFEKPWLDRFLEKLPSGAEVLDLGCGTGDPIDRYLLSQGCHVTGLDGAQAMLDIAQRTFPQATWLHDDMRRLDLGHQFDGVLSWDGFFHLSRQEQVAGLPIIAGHIREGGALLLTIGHEDGEVTGSVEGAPSITPASRSMRTKRI